MADPHESFVDQYYIKASSGTCGCTNLCSLLPLYTALYISGKEAPPLHCQPFEARHAYPTDISSPTG